MSDHEAPALLGPFCRDRQPSSGDGDPAADVVVGRLVARIAELEDLLYRHDLQDSGSDGGCCPLIAAVLRQCV